MRVIVNRALCDGNGECVREAPDVFALDDDENLVLLSEQIDAGQAGRVRLAARACPKAAIRIED
jgi:ferredoxin